MRKELRQRGIESLKVVYSKEEPIKTIETEDSSCNTDCICPKGTTRKCTTRRNIPGSIAFVPSVAGLIIAGEVVKDLIAELGAKTQKSETDTISNVCPKSTCDITKC